MTNENDENAGTARLTRAKAAALTSNVDGDVVKKTSQAKRNVNGSISNATGQARKRAALGDVSNVTKNENVDPSETKDAKKPLSSKTGLVSKAAQPTRIQKSSQTNSTRSILGAKDKNAASSDLKRPASGSGVSGSLAKKRNVSSSSATTLKEENIEDAENIVPSKLNSKKSSTAEEKPRVSNDAQATKLTSKLNEALYEATEDDMKAEDPRMVIQDLDQEDIDDPLMVSEYVKEIFDYLRGLELTTMANPAYMDNQTELEWKMRGILVDWLLEVHTKFRLLPETLFLAVNIIDRFLSCKVVQLDRLQLVGVTALFIASKYEEVLSPHVQSFRHVADDGFTEDEILAAERYILASLNYDLSYPNPMNFLRRISKADNYDIQTRTLGKYLLEISCVDHRFIQYPPSKIAAAAMYLARVVLQRGEWDATIAHFAGYDEDEITPIFNLMISFLKGPVQHEAFFKKYASKKFLKGKHFRYHLHVQYLTRLIASILLRRWAKDTFSSDRVA